MKSTETKVEKNMSETIEYYSKKIRAEKHPGTECMLALSRLVNCYCRLLATLQGKDPGDAGDREYQNEMSEE